MKIIRVLSAYFVLLFSLPVLAYVVSLENAPLKKHPKGAEIRILSENSVNAAQSAFVGRLTVPAGGQIPEHRDASEEHLYILKGSGELTLNGKKYTLKANDFVFMPAGAKASLKVGEKENLEALIIFAPPESGAKFDSWVLDK